jgi:hypothetical protein
VLNFNDEWIEMSVVKSLLNSVRLKSSLAALSALVVVAGTLFGANVASADSIQVQGYQRASQTEACVAQVGETPWQANWGTDAGWKPSWEQWANKGAGGWVCSRSITWAKTPVAASSGGGVASCATGAACALGDIGPGGGLVFRIYGGKTYEMAPKTWSGSGTPDEAFNWCNHTTLLVSGADGTAIGTGSLNTIAMDAACTSGAGQAAADYAGGGKTDWFLPAQDELAAMNTYKSSIPAGMVATYGFASDSYWSSSQNDGGNAVKQSLGDGSQNLGGKGSTLRVRPIRAF